MKTADSKVFTELMKNARVSDAQLAEVLGTSKSNAARTRAAVEKEFIDGYIAVPRFSAIGYEIFAFTFVKGRREWIENKKLDEAAEITRAWLAKHPNVVFASYGEGMGFDGVMISFHRNYSEFVKFKRQHDQDLNKVISESKSFIADLNPGTILKPFHLKYLAEAE